MEPKFGKKRPKSGSKLGFLAIFFKFGSLFFLENASKDSLQQYITSSRDKSQKSKKKKKIGAKPWPKRAKIETKISCLSFYEIWFINIPLNWIG